MTSIREAEITCLCVEIGSKIPYLFFFKKVFLLKKQFSMVNE
ncbi:hypothetical protein [Blattabacterium cuenoti]|nr:hypothetical protein [Blattabacterium cuenoti]